MNLRSFILIAYVRVEKIDFKLNRDVKNDVEKEMIVMLYLDIPYELKESVKKLGARWEPKFKKWYVEKKGDFFSEKKVKFLRILAGNHDLQKSDNL